MAEKSKGRGGRSPAPTPPKEVSGGTPLTQLLFGCGIILLFLLISKLYFDKYLEIRRLQGKLAAEEARRKQYLVQIEDLEALIDLLETDRGVAMKARETLRLVDSDETLVIPLQ